MTEYKIYFLDTAGRIEACEDLEARHDLDAADHAMRSTDPRSFEIWCGNRLVRFVPGLTAPAHRPTAPPLSVRGPQARPTLATLPGRTATTFPQSDQITTQNVVALANTRSVRFSCRLIDRFQLVGS